MRSPSREVGIATSRFHHFAISRGWRALRHLEVPAVVGTPIEGYANGTKVSVEITYDREERVVKVVPLRGEEVIAQAE